MSLLPISSLVMALSVPPSAAALPLRAAILSAAQAAAQAAPQAAAPDAHAGWQQQRDAAAGRRATGTTLAVVGGMLALAPWLSSRLCTVGDDGRCRTSRGVDAVAWTTSAAGVVTTMAGLVTRHRASATLRDLDAHRPK